MKLKKRVISLLLVAIMIFNSIPAGYASAGELTINGNLTDAITDMAYGWDGSKYRFADDVLVGVEDGDEVYLVADVEVTGELKADETVSLELSNFRLDGADAADYLLSNLPETIEKEITILAKTIVIRPAKTHVYYGQDLPEDGLLTELADYSDQLVGNDKVEISCAFEILFNGSSGIGTYDVNPPEEIEVKGKDAVNYTVEVAADLKFDILAYEPNVAAVTEKDFEGNYGGKAEATLTAPEGFLISLTGGMEDSEWDTSVTFKLEEVQSETITYYLRNNDSGDAEYYRAICEKTHTYSSVPKPVVTGIEVALADPNLKMLFREDGVFANGDVLVTVYVQGSKFVQDTTIYLSKNGEHETVLVSAADAVEQDGRYTYQATFEIATSDGETTWYDLDAFAEDSIGVGEKYSVTNSDATYLGSETKVTEPLVIDRAPATTSIDDIEGNWQNRSIRAYFTIEESGAGVTLVEYKWDDGEYKEFGEYDSEESEYHVDLPWYQAQFVPGGRHTFTLRVTDALGNVTEISFTDSEGSDTMAPVIESVEIKTGSGNTVAYGDGAFFSNETVQIIIKAHDNETVADSTSSVSGVSSVVVSYTESGSSKSTKTVKNTELSAYVMTISFDRRLSDIKITVTDGKGLSTTKTLAEMITGAGSSELYVEDNAPSISSNLSTENGKKLGHVDNEGNVWLGSQENDDYLKISLEDGPEKIYSGIASVTIQEGETVFYTTDYAFKTLSDTISLPVAEFTEGSHTITVTVVDNCGNSSSEIYTFIKHTSKPSESEIKVVTEGHVIDDALWFDLDDTIEFRVGTTDSVTKLDSMVIVVNGRKFEFDYWDIIEGDDIYGVTIDTEWLKARGVNLSNENTYTISATIYDLAQNDYDLGPVTVHVDKVAPAIQRITVQKSDENAVEKVLRFLTFGIFANDDLIFRVYADDPEFDSGLDYGTLQGSAEEAPQTMHWDEEKGCYWFEVPAKDKALVEGNLVFAVYDKYGKCTEARPIVTEPSEGEEGTHPPIQEEGKEENQTGSYYVMIETELPWLGFEIPAGDGFTRTDDQIWYNENKDLTMTVHDMKSGIYSVSVKVNDVPVTQDKIGNELVDEAEERLTDAITYYFDVNSLIEVAGKADDGQYRIEIVVTDNAGNETLLTKTFFLDETPPQIDSITFTPATVDGIAETVEFVENLEYGFFFNEDFTVTVNVSDAEPSSGLYAVNYRLVPYDVGVKQAEITGSKRIENGKVVIEAPEGFVGQIFVEALDYASNSTGEKTTKAYVTDSAAPDISITKNLQTTYQDAEGNPLYTQTNSFTVVITDYIAGLQQIAYTKTAEQYPQDLQTVNISNRVYQPGDILDDGWEVISVNSNLVTQVRKTFEFAADDNNISMHFNAMDHSHNRTATVSSEVFTVDTIAPVIRVVFREDNDDDLYYNQNRVADIYVTERNFDAALINVLIQNTFGAVPGYSFSSVSLTEHTATIDFDEGDYTFDVNGSDLSGRTAEVTFSGGNEKLFYVDKTVPAIVENFAEFSNNNEDSFNVDKTAMITITEHNFDPDLTNLRITRKATGEEHSQSGMVDVTAELLSGIRWIKNGDTHSISFTFDKDAVYYIQISPVDLASNQGDTRSTVVFEIDKTVPVVSTKNGNQTGADDTEFLDIYPYDRKDDPVPTVTFTDENISHIEYTLTTYIPEYLEDGLVRIKPKTVQGTVDGNLFTLEDFAADGIYALELVAVDVAGNRSALNANTYARMVHQDVLAFILDSNSAEGTGLYSLEHENGDAISKKPNDFMDLRIFVMAPTGTEIDIVLRDTNGNDIQTEAYCTIDNSVYGIDVSTYEINEAFFRDNFQDDVDMEMNLTVRNQDYRIDLAKIHIDSIAPSYDLPEELFDWNWFAGTEDRTFTITNISELLEEADCKVYDNGVPIPFVYSTEEDTITFTLSKGWHNIGIILSDAAGNANITQEIVNLHIGNFWIILAVSLLALLVAVITIIVAYRRKLAKQEMMEND